MPKTTSLLTLLLGWALLFTLGSPGPATSQTLAEFSPAALARSDGICPPLPEKTGNVITVTTVSELQSAVNDPTPNTTILVADGTYELQGIYLWFDTPGVTLRSASGNREAVVIDGNYETTEIVTIAASNIIIADLTIQRACTHSIHVVSTDGGNTENTLIYNVHIIDPREQAVKINPHGAKIYFPDNGTVACSHIEMTDEGRSHVSGCYTGGVDAHQAWGWTIRDNLIEGFWCEQGLSEHGIHLWTGSRDTVVERNVLVDNARGIGFGLMQDGSGRTYDDDPCPGATGYVGHFDGIIRNNFVFVSRDALFASQYGFDCGICLWQACGAKALHNTVVSTDEPFSSIEWRFSNTDVELVNNLVSHNLRDRGGVVSLAGNLEGALLSLFVDGAGGDLHLAAGASSAIDRGEAITEGLCDDDIDGDPRPIGSAPDVGADEYGTPPPSAVTDLRATHAVTGTGTLTVTLRWTAPAGAVTITLRYSDTLINATNWASAPLLTDTLPGSAETYTAAVFYGGDTVYFALKSQNADGAWSSLSNNAFWPHRDVYLPLVLKENTA